MCANCGFPSAPGHWSDAGSESSSDRIQARFRRVRIIRALLRPIGLTAHDDLATPGVTISTLTGTQQIAENLSAVWIAAETLSGRRIDPLDAAFIREGDAIPASENG